MRLETKKLLYDIQQAAEKVSNKYRENHLQIMKRMIYYAQVLNANLK